MIDKKQFIDNYLNDSVTVYQKLINDKDYYEELLKAVEMIVLTYQNDGKVLVAGNGGSAADAQHIAGELVNKFYFDRPSLPCIALSTDTSVMTAISNDYSFDEVFAKQVLAFGKENDLFIGITTSGKSKNILKALKACKEKNVKTIVLTGNDKSISEYCDVTINIPSNSTPLIQQGHIATYHMICALVEEQLFSCLKN